MCNTIFPISGLNCFSFLWLLSLSWLTMSFLSWKSCGHSRSILNQWQSCPSCSWFQRYFFKWTFPPTYRVGSLSLNIILHFSWILSLIDWWGRVHYLSLPVCSWIIPCPLHFQLDVPLLCWIILRHDCCGSWNCSNSPLLWLLLSVHHKRYVQIENTT